MIPILYESNELSFTANGICRLRDCLSVEVSEERNSVYECDFEYPVDGLHFDLIQPGRIIACTHDDGGDVQPFDIVSYSKPIDGIVSFHAVHVSYRQTGLTVYGKNINSLSAALTMLGTATPANPFTYQTDRTVTAYMAAADGEPRTVRQMLGGVEGSILDTYGGEYEFDKFNTILHSRRGTDRDFNIRYGLNMVDFTEEADYSEVYTAVIPFWRGDDGKGNDVIVRGDMQTTGATSYANREICVPLDLTDRFESKPTKAQVNSEAAALLSGSAPYNPSKTISVQFADLKSAGEYGELAPLVQCKLCDTVGVMFPKYGISARYKIVKTVWNVLLNRYEELELGALATSLSDALGISTEGLTASYSIGVQDLSPTYTRTSGTPETGVTITAKRWGQVVQVNLVFSRYATSTGGDMATGTISGLPAPIEVPVRGVGYNGSAILVASLSSSGAITVRTGATITTSSTSYCYFSLTYLTNE